MHIAVQADGEILVAGYYANRAALPGQPETDDIVGVRYNTNGSVDTTFGTSGVAIASVLKAGLAIMTVAMRWLCKAMVQL